ncbi:J domain-containing protein [Vibrio vulnificus]
MNMENKFKKSITKLLSKPVKAHARAEGKALDITADMVTITVDLPMVTISTDQWTTAVEVTYHWKSGTPYLHWIRASKALIELDDNTDTLPTDPFSSEVDECPFFTETLDEVELLFNPTVELAMMTDGSDMDEFLAAEQKMFDAVCAEMNLPTFNLEEAYETLVPAFTKEELKAAYRRLQSKHHPDRGGKHENFLLTEEYFLFINDRVRIMHMTDAEAALDFAEMVGLDTTLAQIRVDAERAPLALPAPTTTSSSSEEEGSSLEEAIEIAVAAGREARKVDIMREWQVSEDWAAMNHHLDKWEVEYRASL